MGSRGEPASFLNGEVPVVGAAQANAHGGEMHEFSGDASATSVNGQINCDVIVVGAGFSGITAIDRLRKQGLKVKCFESGDSFGGVWYWNRYPGARVDIEVPFYQLNIPEVYRTWNFSERFPDHGELRKYVAHVDQILNLSKDTFFNARVHEAKRDENANVWIVKTEQGHVAEAKYLILATGLLHRTYTPDFPGLGEYKGALHHSGAWPEDFNAKGKRIGLIGAGATAVQITQELGKTAEELTVFLRRPSYCLPMGQRPLTEAEQKQTRTYYSALFKAGRNSATGFPLEAPGKGMFEVSEVERRAHMERMWKSGGFNFQISAYNDVVLNPESNQMQYEFWRQKVCERLTDPEKNKIMAPEKKPYYFATRRSPLEQDYYEVLDQPNVHIHDLSASPLKKFSEKGIITADGHEHELDTIVLATGFDSFTGSLTRIGLKNKDGIDLKDVWADGVSTYLGVTVAGFPNAFLTYTPQAPTALSNGPTIIECQVELIVDFIRKLEAEGAVSIEAERESGVQWKLMLNEQSKSTLFPFTDSWWNGSNVPGKKAENMNYIAGLDVYERQCRDTLDEWKGFRIVRAN